MFGTRFARATADEKRRALEQTREKIIRLFDAWIEIVSPSPVQQCPPIVPFDSQPGKPLIPVVIEGRLHLLSESADNMSFIHKLNGSILPPTASGWKTFVEHAVESQAYFGDLHDVARGWFGRECAAYVQAAQHLNRTRKQEQNRA